MWLHVARTRQAQESGAPGQQRAAAERRAVCWGRGGAPQRREPPKGGRRTDTEWGHLHPGRPLWLARMRQSDALPAQPDVVRFAREAAESRSGGNDCAPVSDNRGLFQSASTAEGTFPAPLDTCHGRLSGEAGRLVPSATDIAADPDRRLAAQCQRRRGVDAVALPGALLGSAPCGGGGGRTGNGDGPAPSVLPPRPSTAASRFGRRGGAPTADVSVGAAAPPVP